MPDQVEDLLSLLDLEPIEVNLFRGESPADSWQRVFGGQVIGQALMAAQRTVEDDRHCHSLHAYFIRPGDPKVPIVYEVDRSRDGRSFTTRRVISKGSPGRPRHTDANPLLLGLFDYGTQLHVDSGRSRHFSASSFGVAIL